MVGIGGTRYKIYVRMLAGQDYSDLSSKVPRVVYDKMIVAINKWRKVEGMDAMMSVKALESGLPIKTCRILARACRDNTRNTI